MKEITIEKGEDILHLELIEVLGLLSAETISNGYDIGEMHIMKIGSNYGDFKFTLTCEHVVEKIGVIERIKRWF